jgi:hypothetical protein
VTKRRLKQLKDWPNNHQIIIMSDEVISKREIFGLIARVAALSAFSYFTLKWLIDAVDPTR